MAMLKWGPKGIGFNFDWLVLMLIEFKSSKWKCKCIRNIFNNLKIGFVNWDQSFVEPYYDPTPGNNKYWHLNLEKITEFVPQTQIF